MTYLSKIERVSEFINNYFVVWVIAASVLALIQPSAFTWIGEYISPLLGVVMLGMGLTLTPVDLKRIVERPRDVVIGSLAQWTIMPVTAYLLVQVFNLPTELGIGIILLGAAPGGTSSNVMTYLGKGDVALSIAITSLTTIVAPIVMPAWVLFLAGAEVQVTFVEMFREIMFVVFIPVVAGLVIRQLMERKAPTAAETSLVVFPSISVIAIVVIVSAVVGLNAENILTVSAVAVAAMIIHNTVGFGSGYAIGHAANMPEDRIRACTFEVGLQNSGLAAALAVTFFTPLTALLPALFSVWMLIVGPTLATYFARKTDEAHEARPSSDSAAVE
ncbi:bile acid:sodium symporter family protein [Haladaptatus caseinilyticus]|uniref:bile acid:sodium symporter family protein n=1 Tax=Haladaptatus caseinilyticus TaxID=2993314 RepID=UPI00224B9B8C|nr:bile acid:sodium symporter family protein [Haladaptatus caseinilyticus]